MHILLCTGGSYLAHHPTCGDGEIWRYMEMWRYNGDVEMGRCEDVEMGRCRGAKIGRCEDVEIHKVKRT